MDDSDLVNEIRKYEKENYKPIFSTGDKIAIGALIITILFNIIGLVFTNISNNQSRVSLEILANKEGVHLEPSIRISNLEQKNVLHGPSKIYITNDGKVEAINVVIQIIRREFNGEDFIGSVWGMGTQVFEELKVYETKEIILPEEYVVNPDYNVIEVRIYYMREYDKKSYAYRTFYFYGGPEDTDFKFWYSIKRAEKLQHNLFNKVIEKSKELPLELFNENFRNLMDNNLYEMKL